MPVDVVYGEARNRAVASSLATELEQTSANGTIYLGYPVIASADESVDVDALFVSEEHGLIALIGGSSPTTEGEWQEAIAEQDRLYGALESYFGRHPELRQRRILKFTIQTITVYAEPVEGKIDGEELFCGIDQVRDVVGQLPPITNDVYRSIQAAVQSVTSIKPAKKRATVRGGSRGATIRIIEKEIANLDRWQKRLPSKPLKVPNVSAGWPARERPLYWRLRGRTSTRSIRSGISRLPSNPAPSINNLPA
jgi:hypothetical protein